jgi:predicted amidophosphoribosyltransferase
VASVFELSEPYRNHLVSVVPRGPGVCAVCWRAVDTGYRLCYPCRVARDGYGRRLAEVVVPIALAVKREQFAHELWHYKYDAYATVRQKLEIRLAAVLWRFLGQHETHVAEAAGVPGFDIVTTVPGTRQRDEDHPLVRIVGTLVGQTRDRYKPVLALGPDASVEGRAVLANRYRAAQAMTDHPAVLLVDDTWTTGGRAQSAAIALHDAGAAKVAVVVLGRHFDRSFGSGETYYQQAKARKFTWDSCCLEIEATAGTNSVT